MPQSVSQSGLEDRPPAADPGLPPQTWRQLVRSAAVDAGFTEAAMLALPYGDQARDAARFEAFVHAGYAGSMGYLARRDEQGQLVRSQPLVPFPWARSVIVCMASYQSTQPLSVDPAPPGAGWIARYAWSSRKLANGERAPSDYHKVLLKRLRGLEAALRREQERRGLGPFESRAYVDTGPIVERAVARAAGLGWTGKNTCLIHPKHGSWNFLAVLVTSIEPPPEQAPLSVPDRCGSCRRCLDACPTGALIAPYRMDATRCIAYLTIEHKGEIDEAFHAGIGRQVFGCDICQDVCPWNRKAALTAETTLDAELEPRAELVNPPLAWLASLDLADFERLFNGSPVRRAGFAAFRRNLAIAMGNTGLSRYLPVLREWALPPGPASGPDKGQDAELAAAGGLAHAARLALRKIDAAKP